MNEKRLNKFCDQYKKDNQNISMRILLKISGEALQNGKNIGTDHTYVMQLCEQICDLAK